MKKLLVLLLVSIFLTGCSVVRIDTSSVDNIVSVVLSKPNKLYNRIGKGYKYYVPKGVTYMDTNDLNDRLYASGNYYYLYIDAISYYHQKQLDYNEKTDAYYSRKLDQNEKQGYLEINEIGDFYFIQFMYNYAKIEAMVEKEEIEQTILDASYILSTIKFNPDIIKLMLNSDYLVNKEEKYDIFSSQVMTDNFLKVVDDENEEEK